LRTWARTPPSSSAHTRVPSISTSCTWIRATRFRSGTHAPTKPSSTSEPASFGKGHSRWGRSRLGRRPQNDHTQRLATSDPRSSKPGRTQWCGARHLKTRCGPTYGLQNFLWRGEAVLRVGYKDKRSLRVRAQRDGRVGGPCGAMVPARDRGHQWRLRAHRFAQERRLRAPTAPCRVFLLVLKYAQRYYHHIL